ncbi:MAG: nitrite reductase small subunit NirD [Alphaproteobacteria bacterium]|nr:nitrite reductase small subunit NirD [Alphaproteobacteria bacterium]
MTEWIEVGPLSGIPPLGSRVLRRPEGDIAIFRAEDDSLFAVDDSCPHRQGPLSQGIVHGHKVTCPLHNWVIELESGSAAAPDEGCVATYPVRVENGTVLLRIAGAAGKHAATA